MKKSVLFIALFLFLLISPALGSNSWDPSFYLGGGYGFSSVDTGINSLTGTAALDEDDSGFKILGGVKINKYLGFELSYNDFGSSELTGNNGDTFNINDAAFQFIANGVKLEAEADSIALEAVVFAPLDELTGQENLKYFEPFFKVGFHSWDVEYTVSASNINTTTGDDDGTDIVFGAGINFKLIDLITLRVEWERFNTEDDIDFFSGSLIINF